MKPPNFFIIGAPKCGTSSLSSYLRNHPEVFVSSPKEPNYFCRDLALRWEGPIETYLALFAEAGPQHLAVGEASTWYLFSAVAAREILAFSPGARLIAMFRNPVDMLYSLHGEFLYNQYPLKQDFFEEWQYQSRQDSNLRHPFRTLGKLGEQLVRLLSVFPSEQVHTVVFDDLASNPRATYLEVLRFLEVSDDGRIDFPRVNPAKTLRSQGLMRFIRSTPLPISNAAHSFKRLLGIERLGVLGALGRLNTCERPRPALSEEARSEIAEYFRSDVELLGGLIGRDLSHWVSQ